MIPPVPTPAPIVSPAGETSGPGISERSLLRDRIDRIVDDAKKTTGGTLGVVVWDLGTNVLVQKNAEQPFPMASVFKLAVAYAAFNAVDRGKLRVDAVRVPISRMIVDNDDAAADALYRMVGGADAINAALHDAGFDAIFIRSNGVGTGAPAAVALFLASLTKGQILSQASRMAFLDELARVKTFPARLRAGLPSNVRLRHKTGTSGTVGGVVDATNDVGVATVNGRDVVIVAMLEDAAGTVAQRDAILADVARAATDATRAFQL